MVDIATQQIEDVIRRLSNDKAFRLQYSQNPDRALQNYLTPEEIQAVKTGDGQRLVQLGSGEKWSELTAALCGPDPGP